MVYNSHKSKDSVPFNPKLLDEYISDNEGDLFKGTRKYFQSELQGKVVSTSIGDVRITGKSWNKIKAGMKRDELKVKLIPYALDILKTGKVTGPSPLSKPRKDGIVEFYFFEKEITIGDYIITAGDTVGKDTQGNLLYNISHDESVSWAKRKGLPDDSRKIAVSQESLKDSENATLDSTIDPREGKINIFILKVIDKNTGERLYDLEDNAGSQDTQQSKEPVETSIDDVDPIAKENIKTAGLRVKRVKRG